MNEVAKTPAICVTTTGIVAVVRLSAFFGFAYPTSVFFYC
jgi:hypothetical protein